MTTFNARAYVADAYFSDLHKDAYGFRPSADRFASWYAMSEEQLDAAQDRMIRAMEYREDQEKQAELAAANAFEGLLRELIATGAGDRATAIRWAMQAEGITEDDFAFYGWSYVEHSFGLAYGYIEGRR